LQTVKSLAHCTRSIGNTPHEVQLHRGMRERKCFCEDIGTDSIRARVYRCKSRQMGQPAILP
jgi:hypothetical protein